MRLLLSTRDFRSRGGVENYVRAVSPALRSQIDALALLTFDEPDDLVQTPLYDGIRHLRPASTELSEVLSTIRGWRPDVVYNQGLGEPTLDHALVREFSTAYYVHDYAGTCISGAKCHSFPGYSVCDRVLGPGCLAYYLPRRCGGLNPLTAVASYRRQRLRQKMLRECRAVCVASRAMQTEVLRNGAEPDHIRLVPLFPPGIRPLDEPPSARTPSGRILMAGRLTHLKGWHRLLKAIPLAQARLDRRLTLVVAGNGPDEAAFKQEAAQRQIPAEFLGWIDTDRRNEELRRADLVAVPSVWPEPFGLVGIEAGCLGVPAVGYDVGGIPDWLIAGESGEIAPCAADHDGDELASAIVRALVDVDHWNRLRRGAWEVARRLTVEAHLESLLPTLRGLIQ